MNLRALFLTTTLSCLMPLTAMADDYEIDDGHSSVLFNIQHFNAAYVYGRFNDVKGNLVWNETEPARIQLDLTVQAASVDTDLDKRDQHLRGPDFFDVTNHPEIRFVSKRVTPRANRSYMIDGELTLHGVTRPITVYLNKTGEGDDPWGGHRLGVETTFTIKRSDFGMTHMLDGLSDEVKLIVALEGKRTAP